MRFSYKNIYAYYTVKIFKIFTYYKYFTKYLYTHIFV